MLITEGASVHLGGKIKSNLKCDGGTERMVGYSKHGENAKLKSKTSITDTQV